MADGNVTKTTVANISPEIWTQEIFYALENYTAMKPLVYTRMNVGNGTAVNFPRIASLSAVDKVAGTAVTFQTNTEAKYTINLNKHKVVPVLIEKDADLSTDVDLFAAYTRQMGKAMAQRIDTDLLALYSGFSQTVGTNTAITTALIRSALQKIDEAGETMETRHMVITPKQKWVMMDLDPFKDASKFGSNDPVMRGQIGEVYGCKVHISENVASVTDVYQNLVFTESAMGLAIQSDIDINALYVPSKVGTEVVADMKYGVGELVDALGVVIKTN